MKYGELRTQVKNIIELELDIDGMRWNWSKISNAKQPSWWNNENDNQYDKIDHFDKLIVKEINVDDYDNNYLILGDE